MPRTVLSANQIPWIDLMPDAAFVIDGESRVIVWNKAMERLTGVAARDMIGKGDYAYAVPFYGTPRPILIDLVFKPQEDIKHLYNFVKLENNAVFGEIESPTLFDGRGAYLWGTAYALTDDSGAIVGAIEYIRDITVSKKAERLLVFNQQSLRESEEKYRLCVETMSEGIATVDPSGCISFVNLRMCQMLDYTRQELLGQKFDIVFDEETLVKIQEHFKQRTQGEADAHYETVMLKKGRREKVLVYMNARGVYDENGSFLYSISVISDITDRKRAEEELSRQRATAQLYLDIVGSIVVALDVYGRVTLINKAGCKLLGYEQSEIVGKDWFQMFIAPSQRDMVRAVFTSIATNENAFPEFFENFIISRDGTERLISWHNSQLINDGHLTGILSSGEDMTLRKRSEEALVASEMQFRTLVERVPAITYISSVDEFQTPRYVSPQVQSFLNVSQADYLKDPDLWWRLIHPDDAPGVRMQMMAQLAENRDAVYEYRVLVPGAATIWFRDKATVVTDNAGKALFIQGIRYDITDLKVMQQSLVASRENFNNIVNNIKDGIVICDKDGITHFINPTAEFLLNRKAGDFVGKAFEFSLVDGTYTEINTVSGFSEPGVAELRVTKTVWESADMFLVTLHDITERKRAEERIRAAAKEWRTTFDSITDRIAIIDNNMRILRVNQAFADSFNMKPEETISLSCQGLIRDAAECGLCPHKKAVETKAPVSDQYYSVKDRRYWEITCSPLFDKTGYCIAVIHISKDITMRKELEKNNRLAQLGKLVADMAHEVNNPLMIISGRAQLSLMEQIGNAEVCGNLKTITDECQRAKTIIQRLLRFSKPGTHEFQNVNIHQCIDGVVNLLKHQYSVAGIAVNCAFAPGQPIVFADQNQLQEVFMNIMSNARDAMTGGGTLTIETHVEGDTIKIVFKDSGIGMSAEVMKKLFEPFFTTKDKGTGLGLSVCYGIIKNHGGQLHLDSAPSQGTSVTITLPDARVQHSGAPSLHEDTT